MLTPKELSDVVLRTSVNTLRGSRTIPAAQKLFIWVGASGGRVNICLPTHFVLCDDKGVNWARLKETDEDIFFDLNWMHAYFNSVLFSFDSKPKRVNAHVLLLASLRVPSLSAVTEVVSVRPETLVAWSLRLRWEKRVNFLVYQSQPI